MLKNRRQYLILMGVGLGLLLWGSGMATANNPGASNSAPGPAIAAQQGAYTCPMHPEVLGNAGDRCPKCGMNLEASEAPQYVCPMHPEVTGKAGDDCPRCGMELEPKEGATAPGGIGMRFSTAPASGLKPNQEVSLIMTPISKEQPDARIGLDVEHDKKIHLIVVNEDLSWFDHIHPEEESDGSYRVTEKFPSPGRYTLFADYKPTGGDHLVDRLNVNVEGAPAPAKTYGGDRLTSDAGDGFSAVLTLEGGDLVAGQPVHLEGTILKNGKELDVNALEDYLGAKAHMVVVSIDDKEYLHVHPGVDGSTFDLHTTLEKPGVYRGWLQFQSAGKIYTTDFVFNVREGQATSDAHNEHAGHQH